MLTDLFPLLLSMQNALNCLEKILDRAQFDTVALLHLNTTTDIAENMFAQLSKNESLVWMKFNIHDVETFRDQELNYMVVTPNVFSVFVLDVITDWQYVMRFSVRTRYNYRVNHMYVVNKYPSAQLLVKVGYDAFNSEFFNCGFLFWNITGNDSRMEIFTFNFYREKFIFRPLTGNDQCSDNIHNRIFFDKVRNLHGTRINIYGHTDPPKVVKTSALINGQYAHSLGGHDVLIADTVATHLNVTANYKLMTMIMIPVNTTQYLRAEKAELNPEQKFFNVSQIVRYNLELISDFNSSLNILYGPGLDMNSEKLNYDSKGQSHKHNTFLYPHDTDNFILIVPRRFKSKTDYSNILNSPLIFVWGPITVVATITRFMFNKIIKLDRTLTDTYFQMFGLSLGMSFSATIPTAAENVFLWWFCLGTMLSGTLLSSDMLQGFALQRNIPAINNLIELEMSGMEIYLPNYIDSVRQIFENMPVNLKLVNTVEFTVNEMISNQNMSNAYVTLERKFNILFRDTNAWHVLERFGAEHLSYKIHYWSVMEERLNKLIQRCVDHGLRNYLIAKNERLLRGIRPKDSKDRPSIVQPVSIINVQEPLLMYAAGITVSSIWFTVEKVVTLWKRNSVRNPN